MTTSCSRSIKLIDVFPDWLIGGGIFAIMAESVVLPWSEIIDGASLDVEYFGNRSGSKPVAPLVYKLLDDSGELSEENRAKLVGAIWNRYGRNWTALYNTTIAEYNPLDNYNMEERDRETGSNSTTYGKTVAETVEREGNNQTSVSNDNTVNRKHYGFNSVDGVPVDTDSAEGSTAGSGSETITEERNITDGGRDSSTISNEKVITRKGNIGVTTSQQLLQSERELWFWNFIDSVFADVDTMLTLAVFEHSECIQIFKGGSGSDYILPVASPSVLGGVQPNAKTSAMTQPVGVDSAGRLWVQVPDSEGYTLPVATSTRLGGVKPNTKTSAMTQPVGVDSTGKLWVQVPEAEGYTLPVATPSVLGGVQPNAKTESMTQPVGVDSTGKLWVQVPEAESYTLPVATANTLGGVKPNTKTSAMTQPVGVDSSGRLWTEALNAGTSNVFELYLYRSNSTGNYLYYAPTNSLLNDSVYVSLLGGGDTHPFYFIDFTDDAPTVLAVEGDFYGVLNSSSYIMYFYAFDSTVYEEQWRVTVNLDNAVPQLSTNHFFAINSSQSREFFLEDITNDPSIITGPSLTNGSYFYVHLKFYL